MENKYLVLLITVFFLTFTEGNAFGQGPSDRLTTISSVVQGDDGEILSNATVFGNEGATNVQTGADGQFTISVVRGSNLRIEAKGYNTSIIPISSINDRIILVKSPFLMAEDDDINIPFGQIKRRETTNAIDVINISDILPIDNTLSVRQILSGRASGMSNTLNLRGMGEALVLVDGVPRDLNFLTTHEIDQITVLKDVNASVLYGTQAKNGVILITTKQGDPFKRTINFSLDRGFAEPVALPSYLGSAEYMTLYNEAALNDGLSAPYSEEHIQNYASGSNPYRYPNIDYYSSEFLRSSRPETRFASNFSGGNGSTQYYANLGLINQGSLYNLGEGSNAASNRLNTRANVTINLTDRIRSFVEGVVVFDINKGPNGNFWNYSSTMHPHYFAPLIPVSLVEDFDDIQTARIINGEYILGGTSQYQENIYGNMFLGGYNQNIRRMIAFNNVVEFDLEGITKGLTFKTQVNIDMLNDFQQNVNNNYSVYNPSWTTEEDGSEQITALQKIGADEAPGTQNLDNADYYRRTGFNAVLDYNNTFDNVHTISGTLLGYYTRHVLNYRLVNDKPAHIGFRARYDYARKYFVDYSSAYVYSVRLAEGNRGAYSPTIGLGWVLSQEDFLSGSGVIDYLKLKLSAGILNTDIDHPGHNLYLSTLSQSNFYGFADGVGSNQSIYISRQNNFGLTFEKVKNVNLGVEGYFLNNALNIDANVFYTENSGKVTQRVTLPAYFANFRAYENYNIETYSGLDLGINWLQTFSDFSFNLGGNLLLASSNVKTRDEIWQEEYMYREGYPVDARFGLEANGFFRDEADIENSPMQEFGEVRPGDVKYVDQNGDGIINSNDMVYLGRSLESLSFGVHLTFNYKSFSLFALGTSRQGGNSMYSGNYFWVDGLNKYSEEVLNRWTPETASTATYPRLTTRSSSNNYQTSTMWLYDRAYFRLDRIQLTYELPQNIVSRIGSSGLSIFVRGSNLLMLAEDAEKRQLNIGSEPDYRNYAIGLRANF